MQYEPGRMHAQANPPPQIQYVCVNDGYVYRKNQTHETTYPLRYVSSILLLLHHSLDENPTYAPVSAIEKNNPYPRSGAGREEVLPVLVQIRRRNVRNSSVTKSS